MTSSTGEKGRTPKGPKAIGRVLDLLLLLSKHREGLSLAEISTAMAVPKSTFLDTLRGLCDLRYLMQEEGRYRLGPVAYRLAGHIMSTWSAPDIVRQPVKMLARATHESVGFAIADWEIGQAIYTEAINSTQPVRYAMHVGIRAPLYASAAGRVLLAYAEPARITAYLRRAKLRALTDSTRTTESEIMAHLEEIRRIGYCASFGEMLSDTAALSVPVFGPDDQAIGAMMLAAPLDRMRVNYDSFLQMLIDAGHEASGQPVTPVPEIGQGD
ncbi:IclR family transcriptional regulator [Rhizorhabdus dicambivorans]|uniref:IclR family transcriptional regulator n=1 Tax=Rhizorhabdus dicambivorans TaxID=1850238 RepID=A0A2A4FV16_9SPHN|nr:IclR family transcriptional regulator [Rhizorhabdus dicambivorans]ATE63921.1 IclR family transcriptional regulator [Rhizorhabdus dicambivorans]PCE41526.1 IclR family transcriptional regulator [Rhizorhabdus dicambivorans]